MAKFQVGWDGRWQRSFATEHEAVLFAEGRAALEPETLITVRQPRWFRSNRFVTAFPEDERVRARALVEGAGLGGGGPVGGFPG